MSSTSSSIGMSLDAVSLLGFGPKSPEALPEAKPGETIIRYGGWSLLELRNAMAPRGLMPNQDWDWYDEYTWTYVRRPAATYVLRLPIPESDRKTFAEQTTLFLYGEYPIPIVLAASALLAIQVSGGTDPLKGGRTRCKEKTVDGSRIGLRWYDRHLSVDCYREGSRFDDVWLSAARKIG